MAKNAPISEENATEGRLISTTIEKNVFSVPQRYYGGETINAAEAAVLNQTLLQNVANNKRKEINNLLAAATTDEELAEALEKARKIFSDYAAAYEFSLTPRRIGSTITDPLEAEKMRIAKRDLTAAVRKQLKKSFDEYVELRGQEVVDAKLAELMADPELIAEAEANLARARAKSEKVVGIVA